MIRGGRFDDGRFCQGRFKRENDLGLQVSGPGREVFSPTSVAGIVGWYDAADYDSLTLNGNEVTAVANQVGAGGGGLTAVAEGGPTYDPANSVANGKPALVWPNGSNRKGLWLGWDAPLLDLFVVLAYRDGTVDQFSEFQTIFTDVAGLTGNSLNRVMGEKGKSNIYPPSVPAGITFSINDGAPTSDILPLSLSVLHVKGVSPFNLAAIGSKNGGRSRAWSGVICEVLAYGQPVSTENTASIISALSDKWGT